MPRGSHGGFPIPALVVSMGMLLPAVPIAMLGEVRYDPTTEQFVSVPMIGTLDHLVFLFGLGLLFTLASWVLVERVGLDRLDYLLVSIIWPWVVVLGSVFVVFSLTGGSGLRAHPVGRVFSGLTGGGTIPYGTAFMAGGMAAYGLTQLRERYQHRSVTGTG